MSHTKASLQGQDKETLEDILWTWKIIQASPDCWVTMHEADEMVRLITNELKLKE